ncbi:MAG: hypothetical protein K9K75_04315 [Deltaproteobacteria bacterium]|nr:hypothetical protein [Deltaproteobacteria bacterium]
MAMTLGDITQELNEKVLAPAKAEAAELVASATKEAASILEQAKAEALKIRQDAKSEADRINAQMQVEMETAARNFIIMVHERLEATVVPSVVHTEIKATLCNTDFLKNVIEKLLVEFAKGHQTSLDILLPNEIREEMTEWFLAKFREKMGSKLTVHFSDKVEFGFHLGAGDGKKAYFNFGTGLVEAFSAFCSPRFREYFLKIEE